VSVSLASHLFFRDLRNGSLGLWPGQSRGSRLFEAAGVRRDAVLTDENGKEIHTVPETAVERLAGMGLTTHRHTTG
jgi:hypothetical protein